MEATTTKNQWSSWIAIKYDEFRRGRGKSDDRGALTAFARLFGAHHQVVAAWMRPEANPPRKPEYIARLVELYGDEAYVALGMPVPSDGGNTNTLNENRALEMLRAVPSQYQEELLEKMELFLFQRGFRRVK